MSTPVVQDGFLCDGEPVRHRDELLLGALAGLPLHVVHTLQFHTTTIIRA